MLLPAPCITLIHLAIHFYTGTLMTGAGLHADVFGGSDSVSQPLLTAQDNLRTEQRPAIGRLGYCHLLVFSVTTAVLLSFEASQTPGGSQPKDNEHLEALYSKHYFKYTAWRLRKAILHAK